MATRDFNILRFQECSENILPSLKRHKFEVFFWIFAVITLFFMLGAYPGIRSETRWFEISREMILSHDFLHPQINGQPYFDKPLLTYWLNVVAAYMMNHGVVNEFVCRIQAVLSCLLAIGCTIKLTRFISGSYQAGTLAGWLMLTTYSILLWGRLAEADMAQVAFILSAVTVYMVHRERTSLPVYLFFWFLCGLGAHAKGLPAFVTPPLLVLLDCVLRKNLKKLFHWKFVLAFLFGVIVYFIPFVLSAVTSADYASNGLILAFRENLMRVFNPWDHKDEPFYCYFLFVPRLLIPWTPFFILALVDFFVSWKKRKDISKNMFWLLFSILGIFLLFSISKSRRSYYILPIVPFCIMLTAIWLTGATQAGTVCGKISNALIAFADFVTPMICLFFIMAPFTIRELLDAALNESGAMDFFPSSAVYDDMVRAIIPFCLLAFLWGTCVFCWWLVVIFRGRKGKTVSYFRNGHTPFNRSFIVYGMLSCFILTVAIPTAQSIQMNRQEEILLCEIGQTIRQKTKDDPGFEKNVVFFGSLTDSTLSFYLGLSKPVLNYNTTRLNRQNRKFTDDSVTLFGLDEFKEKMKVIQAEGGFVITSAEQINKIKDEELKSLFLESLGNYAENAIPSSFSPFVEKDLNKNYLNRENPKSMRAFQKQEGKRLLIYVFTKTDSSVSS